MTIIDALAYAADVAILSTYALLAHRGGKAGLWFHLANGIGAIPIIATEVIAGATQALILTAAFGVIGWVGVFSYIRQRRSLKVELLASPLDRVCRTLTDDFELRQLPVDVVWVFPPQESTLPHE